MPGVGNALEPRLGDCRRQTSAVLPRAPVPAVTHRLHGHDFCAEPLDVAASQIAVAHLLSPTARMWRTGAFSACFLIVFTSFGVRQRKSRFPFGFRPRRSMRRSWSAGESDAHSSARSVIAAMSASPYCDVTASARQ